MTHPQTTEGTPLTDREDRPYPSPEHCQLIQFEGATCAAIAPEDYEALYEQSRQLERDRDKLAARVAELQHIIDCANTPLMRDVLQERDEAKAKLAEVERERDESDKMWVH